MKDFLVRHGLTTIFAVGIVACFGVGWALEHKAFTPAAPAGQAFAVVFVQDRAAAVSLTATVNPDTPWRDRLTVHVKGAPVQRDRWLLVIECPPGSAASPHPGVLTSEPAGQASQPASAVTVYSGGGPLRTVKLGCFIRNSSNSLNQSNTPGYASIGSVTLPALETDQAIANAVSVPVLYAQQQTSSGPVQVIQFFPRAGCPAPVLTATQRAGGPAIPSAARAAAGAGPAPATGPGTGGCGRAQARTAFSEYYLPSSVQTKETLTNVNLTGYQVESIFPNPQITSGIGAPGQGAVDNYTWTGLSGLSPSMMLSNLAGQQAVSHYTFIAGVLLGIAGGAVASFLEHLWPDLFPKPKRRKKKELAASGEISPGEPALAHASAHAETS